MTRGRFSTRWVFPLCILLVTGGLFSLRADEKSVTSSSTLDPREFRTFLENLIARKLTAETISALSSKGFREDQIEQVLTSLSFKKFVSRVIEHPLVERELETLVHRITNPPDFDQKVLRQYQDAVSRDRLEAALKIQQALRDKRLHREASKTGAPKSVWERLSKKVKEYFWS